MLESVSTRCTVGFQFWSVGGFAIMLDAAKSRPSKFIILPLLSLTLLGVTGCGMPNGVVWLPDSSGIIYSDKEGSRLVQFDLAKQASRVVVGDTNTHTTWPGLRADGKRVAVAKVEEFKTKDSNRSKFCTQVFIYELDGTLAKQSRVHESFRKYDEPSKETETVSHPAALNWAGPEDKIIVAGGQAAIYDCQQDLWIELEEMIPAPFGNMPTRPDGKGFVAIAESKQGEHLCFIDWDGWIKKFDHDPLADSQIGSMIGAAWNGNVYVLHYKDVVFEFDTTTMKASRKQNGIQVIESEGELTAYYRFAENDSQLCHFTKEKTDNAGNKTQEWKLEIQKPAKGKSKVIATSNDYETLSEFFFPSPDGAKVAIDMTDESGDQRVILVIDNEGKTLARVKPDE